ncbi:CrcB family protein [Alkalilimnicola ehrlichii]|nr:CrcB family protein [Alkalilimnicola ehrlichii]
MKLWLWVALGSALGGSTRYLCGVAVHSMGSTGFPWETLWVNVTGSFLIGLFATWSTAGRLKVSVATHQFIVTGFLGGYTTFSLFSLESLRLLEKTPLLGWLYMGSTLSLSLFGVWLGYRLALTWVKP